MVRYIKRGHSHYYMIPEFPQFKKLELSDKKDIEKFTSKFPPYSDFNFVSMWSWDIKGEMRVSQMYGNFVVRFTDYITNERFYSFLGNNKVNEIAQALLDLSQKDGLKPILKLVPEHSITGLDEKKFKIKEDRNHFDYIYEINELRELKGGKFSKKRNQVASFLNNYPKAEARIIDLKNKSIQGGIINLFTDWLKLKIEKENIYKSHEEVAVNRLLLAVEACKLVGVGISINDKLSAFLINELTESEYVVAHASKIDRSFIGINSFLMKKNAEILHLLKKSLFNYEQDLGLDNLRDAKVRFRPKLFLKKYQLTL